MTRLTSDIFRIIPTYNFGTMEIDRAGLKTTMEIDRAGIKTCAIAHITMPGLQGQIMLINFHLTSKESRAQSNLFSNSISAALRQICKYANDRCEVFFGSRLFFCVFVSGNFVFVG